MDDAVKDVAFPRLEACGERDRFKLAAEAITLAPTVSVVVPALDEEFNLPAVLRRIPNWIDEVILVDGHSRDNTLQVARETIPDIIVVQQDRPGKGAALRCGFRVARGDIIVMLDADGSTDPAEIPAFVGALIGGADLAKGSRFLQGGGTADMEWYRKVGNWAFVQLVRLRFGGKFSDLCYGYAAFWRHILNRIDLEGFDGFEIETSISIQALRAKLRIAEVPSMEYRRVYGRSHLRTVSDGWRILRTILSMALARPAEASRQAVAAPGEAR